MIIPGYITSVLDILYNNGFEGYLVGGCVRDAMMGTMPHDFDLTTNALPDEMLRIFSGHRIIETGLKHGTVTVVSEGENVEITTYRIDGTYLDNRRPSDVTFTRSLGEDLSRRDFTVNALAYSPKDGLVDLFGGMADLENAVIRCVGEPDRRFGEDGLRIMRALRFAAVLGFDIHKDTSLSIHNSKHLLSNISAERIYAELKKLLCGKSAADVICEYSEVFFHVFESVTSDCRRFCSNAASIGYVADVHWTRLAALLFGFGDDAVSAFMRSLKPDNHTFNAVKNLCRLTRLPIASDKYSVRRLMSEYDDDIISAMADIARIYRDDFDYDAFMSVYTAQKEANPCVRINQLAVSGNDLISFGIPKGPQIGEMMHKILDAVIEDKCINTYSDIKEYVGVL